MQRFRVSHPATQELLVEVSVPGGAVAAEDHRVILQDEAVKLARLALMAADTSQGADYNPEIDLEAKVLSWPERAPIYDDPVGIGIGVRR